MKLKTLLGLVTLGAALSVGTLALADTTGFGTCTVDAMEMCNAPGGDCRRQKKEKKCIDFRPNPHSSYVVCQCM